MRRTVMLLASLAVAMLVASGLVLALPSGPVGRLDANYNGSTSSGYALNQQRTVGQTFTAVNSGLLTSARVLVSAPGYQATDFQMQIVEVDSSGRPSSVLASATDVTFTANPGSLLTGYFRSPVSVVSGKKYALLMLAPTVGPMDEVFGAAQASPSGGPYAGGNFCYYFPGDPGEWICDHPSNLETDLFFEIYVTPPEDVPPTSVAIPPSDPNSAGWYQNEVLVGLSAADGQDGSGVKEITHYSTTTCSQASPPTTVPDSSSSVRVTSEGTTTITYFAEDWAGNTEVENTLTVRLDSADPRGDVVIKGGRASTTSRTVTLTLNATDLAPGSGVASLRLKNAGGNWTAWQPYTTSKDWKLARRAGKKTVYAQYRDAADNVSASASDSITYRP